MHNLTIVNGQFVDIYGQIVPIKFGDREQIAIFRKIQRTFDLWDKQGNINLKIDRRETLRGYTVNLIGKCSSTISSPNECGNTLKTRDAPYENFLKSFNGYSLTCKCGCEYEIVYRKDLDSFKAIPSDGQ